jgi:sarcosine oxidase
MKHYDVAIIGGGIHGMTSANSLSKLGKSVVLCEQFEFGHLRGGSHGPTRIFRMSYSDPDYVSMASASLAMWRKLEEEAGVSLLELNGCVDHGDGEKMMKVVATMDSCAISSEILPKEEARERWPNLNFDDVIIFQPGGGRLYARAILSALYEVCESRGVDFFEFMPVRKISNDISGKSILECENKTFSADVVVSCAGAWTYPLLKDYLPLAQPMVTQDDLVFFASSDPGAIWPNIRHHSEVDHFSQEAPGVGILVGQDKSGQVLKNADDRDFIVDPLNGIRLCDYVEKYMPGLKPEPISSQTYLSSFNKSGDFIVDRVGNIVVVQAGEQQGFKFSPLIGKYVSELVTGKKFSQLRFRL